MRASLEHQAYRDSPLSTDLAHDGGLYAGDRVPDFRVRTRSNGGWRDESLSTVLDPSRFVLLVVCPDQAGASPPSLTDVVRPWAGLISSVNINIYPDSLKSRDKFLAFCD
jgi:hypothetical protein